MCVQTKLRLTAEAKAPERDPTLLCCAFRKQRLYLFTRKEPEDAEDAAVRVCCAGPPAHPCQ